MPVKKLLQFPELLLLIAALSAWLLSGRGTLDIHIHDTYYIFNNTLFYAPFYGCLFLSWALHRMLRRQGLFTGTKRWMQVMVSIACIAVIVITISYPGLFITRPRRYIDYSTWTYFHSYNALYRTTAIAVILFALFQLAFWIIAVLLLVRKR